MNDTDDLDTFRAAVAGIKPLPPANRAVLEKPKPEPRPRSVPAAGAERSAEAPEFPFQGYAQRQGSSPECNRARSPECDAFERAMSGVLPLAPLNRVQLGNPPPLPRPLQFLRDEQAALHESLHAPIGLQDRLEGGDEPHYLRSGLANTVLRDLRRGRWVLQDEIDLHGLNRDEARQQLASFLGVCLQQGKRCVRVIHGKGHGSPQKLSILRQLVRGWLAQRHEVLAYCQAKPQDGGEGALIALLRAPKK